jgi:ribosome biogenesis GTPase A
MVCNGVYPIDNLREYMEPIKFLTDSVPRKVLEYVLKCSTSSDEYKIDASRLLHSYSVSRGYMMQGSGLPDYNKSARLILKALVNGEIIFARLPPGELESKNQFNIVPDAFTIAPPLISEKDNKGRRFKNIEFQIENINEEFFEGILEKHVIDVYDLS